MCAHGNGPASRCSSCLQAAGALAVPVQRVELDPHAPIAPSPRAAYGRRGALAMARSRRAVRAHDSDDKEDDHG